MDTKAPRKYARRAIPVLKVTGKDVPVDENRAEQVLKRFPKGAKAGSNPVIDKLVHERDLAMAARNHFEAQRNEARADLVTARNERDEAIAAKDHFEAATRQAEDDRRQAEQSLAQVKGERDDALRELEDTLNNFAASQASERTLRAEVKRLQEGWIAEQKGKVEAERELQQAKEAIAKDRAEIALLHEVRLDAQKDDREDRRQQEQEAHQRTMELASMHRQIAETARAFDDLLTSRNTLINQRRDLITERDTYRKVIDLLVSKLG